MVILIRHDSLKEVRTSNANSYIGLADVAANISKYKRQGKCRPMKKIYAKDIHCFIRKSLLESPPIPQYVYSNHFRVCSTIYYVYQLQQYRSTNTLPAEMRPFAVIGVMAAVASVVSAGCFHDGTTGNKVLGHSAIDTVCQTFQGNFLKAQSRTSCATDTATGSSWFFEVKLKNSDTVLKLQACKDGLSPEVSGCDHGGEKTEDGWYWK